MADPQPPSPTPTTPSSAISAGEFGAAFKGFLEHTVATAPVAEPVFAARLRAHFGTDPAALPIVAEQFEPSEHPNLQAALDAWLQQSGRSFEAIGVTSEFKRFNGLGLADILTSGRTGLVGGSGPAVGPVEYVNVTLDRDQVMTCLQFGLLLVRDGEVPLTVLADRDVQWVMRYLADGLDGAVSVRTVTTPTIEVDVLRNGEYNRSRIGTSGDDFLYFPFMLDVSPANMTALKDESFIEEVTRLLARLRLAGIRYVASCDFEQFLPDGGRTSS
jgi:hypothetical protein